MPSKKLFKKKIHVTHVPMVCSLLSLGLVIALLLAATIVIWQDQGAWQTRKTAFDQRALTQRMNDLEQRWTRFAGCLSPASVSSSSVGIAEAKILMPNGPTAADHWNSDEATTVAEYRDEEKGLTFKVPFNPAWGNDKYHVSQFEMDGDGVLYGPVQYAGMQGNNWNRPNRISITVTRTKEEAMAAYKKIAAEDSEETVTIKDINLGGFPLISVVRSGGVGSLETLEFIGKKYNYVFSQEPWSPFNTKVIEQILKTLKSI